MVAIPAAPADGPPNVCIEEASAAKQAPRRRVAAMRVRLHADVGAGGKSSLQMRR